MFAYVSLDQINDNPFQARQVYGDVGELAADIRRHAKTRPDTLGLQQVPTGRVIFRSAAEPDGRILTAAEIKAAVGAGKQLADDPAIRVELEFGHRRLRAFSHLVQGGYERYGRLPITLLPLTDEQMLDGVWSENEARKQLSDVERAELIRTKLDAGHTQQEVADAWGLSRPTVSWLLSLLQLPEEVKEANRQGRLPARTAYALRAVDRVRAAANGHSWSDLGKGVYYARPTEPDAFINRVLDNPEKVTSDSVRDYVERALRWAGRPLPAAVAKFEAEEADGIVQPKCRGCRFRVNSSCLQPDPCLAAKKQQLIAARLVRAANALGAPISDNMDDFLPAAHDHETRQRIARAWELEIEADYVVGWLPAKRSGIRPYAGDSYIYDEADLFANDGRAGIAIGVRGGDLTAGELADLQVVAAAAAGEDPDAVEVEDIAGPDKIAAWRKEAGKLVKEAEKLAKTALVDHLYLALEVDVVQALMHDPEKTWIDESEKVIRQFVNFMWQKGQGVKSYFDGPLLVLEHVPRLLNRAGIGDRCLAPVSGLRELAILALYLWYDNRQFSWGNNRERAQEEMAGLLARWPEGGADQEMAELYEELQRALRDAERILAPADEVVTEMEAAYVAEAAEMAGAVV